MPQGFSVKRGIMWARLILSLLLVHCLAADGCVEAETTTPIPTSTTTAAPWSKEAACADVTSGVALLPNEDDPTCTSYVYCYVTNGAVKALIKSCKANHYFSSLLRTCVTSTTTAAPWSTEAACADVTSGTALLPKEDDPTCTSYVYCYFINGAVKAFIKNCKGNQYFDSSLRACVETKPDYCT